MGVSLATKYIVYLFPTRPLSHHQSPPRTKVRLHFCIHFSMMVRNLLIMFPNSSCQNIKWLSQRLKSTSFAIYCNVIEGELLLYFLLYKSVLISLQSVCHVRALRLFCFATTGKWEMEQFQAEPEGERERLSSIIYYVRCNLQLDKHWEHGIQIILTSLSTHGVNSTRSLQHCSRACSNNKQSKHNLY